MSEFSKVRACLWPIHRHELAKFLPMVCIFFLICFNYNILRATKDTLIVTAPGSGAEAIPFIKVWVILPSALIMTFIFTRFSNWLHREKVFHALMSLFLLFFTLFAFVLYPYRDILHPHGLADQLEKSWPLGLHGLIAMVRNWTCTLYYIMAEMWSTMIMTVLFWGFANDVTSVQDARRHYLVLGITANVAGILSGLIATTLSRIDFHALLPFGASAWEQSFTFQCGIIITNCMLCVAVFRYMHSKGYGYSQQTLIESFKKEAPIRMGLRKSFSYLLRSRYLLLMALIVVMYNLALNIVEVVWKDQVKQLHPHPADFNAYMGEVLTGVGVVATLIAVFVSGNVLRKATWTLGALITPTLLAISGFLFFSMILLQGRGLDLIAGFFGTSPLIIAVFLGSLQNCLARGAKYTVFDATKEMAFIPLSRESRLKGKAAIDGVGSRIGKSGGSLLHQGLLLIFGTISLSTPYVALILIGIIAIWMVAVRHLGKEFHLLTTKAETAAFPTSSPMIDTETAR